MELPSQNKIVVIGAGVVGLSVALALQEKLSHCSEVTLVADSFNVDTLSHGAGGLFSLDPYLGPTIQITRKWGLDSYNHFLSILSSENAADAGVQFVSGYQLSTYSQNALKKELLDELFPSRPILKEELKMFPRKYKFGIFFSSFVVDCRYYLPWMERKFENQGGKTYVKTVNSLRELENFDLVINCTGLRAKELTKDPLLTPIRGQTIKVKAPWIKHFYYGNEAYVIPGVDAVTLGGIKQFGNSNPEVEPYHHTFIWDKCTELVPSLKRAEIIDTWVGLRPFRVPVRVEPELIPLANGSTLKVVHCYGHGANGVSLSWGTAVHAVQLAEDMLLRSKL